MATGEAAAGQRHKTKAGAANIDKILDSALSAFARHGLRGTRIEQIAEGAGMSKTNLLYYFRSKEALYAAVLTRTLSVWLSPLAELDAVRDPASALTAYIGQKLDCSRRYPDASRLFAIEIMQGAPHLKQVLATELTEVVEDKVAIIRGWIADGRLRPIEPHHLLFMIWATTQHYADFAVQISAITGKDLSDEAFYEDTRRSLTETILRGVLSEAAGLQAASD
ncbi:HTH-type transcriptional regulator RutR [Labrys monachus]|uniref:TetR/AcrR family transcriptional regulator n=1 Tax=Labrys monachus TaxID=217067 RepID=A0ABU0FK96_9HYPH|nr:HTH-type transcriptional regulator RutR [Labrys monachus]MDQ0394503.1 TetR/AcrR family transcriptional regulator [Labrys monachus]